MVTKWVFIMMCKTEHFPRLPATKTKVSTENYLKILYTYTHTHVCVMKHFFIESLLFFPGL